MYRTCSYNTTILSSTVRCIRNMLNKYNCSRNIYLEIMYRTCPSNTHVNSNMFIGSYVSMQLFQIYLMWYKCIGHLLTSSKQYNTHVNSNMQGTCYINAIVVLVTQQPSTGREAHPLPPHTLAQRQTFYCNIDLLQKQRAATYIF